MKYNNHRVTWNPGTSLEEMEMNIILNAFAFYKENKTHTAQSLGICIRTLENKLKIYKDSEEERIIRESEHRQSRAEFLARCRGKTYQKFAEGQPQKPTNMESTEEDTAQYEMPMLEREEIQDVLHEQVTHLGPKRGRPTVSRANG